MSQIKLTPNPIISNQASAKSVSKAPFSGPKRPGSGAVKSNPLPKNALPQDSVVSGSSLWKNAESNFKAWDKNGDGHLTDQEIELALKAKHLTLNQQATLHTFRGRQKELQKAHNDEWLLERRGTTLEDLKAFQKAGNGEAERLNEQFKIEKSLASEPKEIKEKAALAPDRPADLSEKIGTRDYYIERYKDFRRRNPNDKPPSYYLNYGLKYCDRFRAQKENSSPAMQDWIDKTTVALQEKMEAVNAKPEKLAVLERNAKKFQSFAYASHPSAYLESGLHNVPYRERIKIVMVPDVSDILTLGGLKQAVHTGGVVVAQDIGEIACKTGELINSAAKSVGEWILT